MFLLPVAALAMASCSSSEDVAQNVQTPSQELKFFPAVEGTTRGAIETSSSISKFYLYATGDLKTSATDGTEAYSPAWQEVTKNGSNWNPATKLYWAKDTEVSPAGPATGNFLAFANATKAANGTEHDGTGITSQLDIVIPTDLSKQKDLVVAYNSGLRTVFTSGVPLHFRHALSQIVVNATYANDADQTLLTNGFPELDIKVKGVKFVGLKDQGSLNLPTASTASGQTYEPVWGSQSGTEEFAAAPASAVGLSSTAQFIDQSAANSPLLLMPQTTAATTDLAATTVTGAYLMVQVDINYKTAFKPGGATYKMIDLYPKPTAALSADQENADNDSWAWIAVPVDIAWKGGYKYTYTLNFSNIAAGKVAPGEHDAGKTDTADGEPVIGNVRTPVNFLVTVEKAWIDGGSFTPAM